ncbi:oligosaccharyl transferase [Pyrococcus abyssi]|uniref:dolichyl-phosphooligosaccharide-protein glycotransferase n=1 Tax=Pyrococcus abyssi (strain GE5 / Orsay) TaxID=272844 RepID=Q9UYP5_PYRAB|nr:oligosaccharyl transferase [Pyrococcus abyssi]CAB50367.1 Oligosaccharyl transferase, STT3 subunit [Pyrococcus abyssi GE5]CCE70911.1 TPA: transmembrane oligosaccharyl transferase, putative [Pyrococcus abyssi GE5]
MRNWRILEPKIALPIVVLVGVTLRVIPLRFKYLLGYDPYFHLAYIEESLKAGKWFNFFTIANGPWGFQIKSFHPLGLWMTPAYIYRFLKVFGISVQTVFKITPVIFGTLTIVFFYISLLKLYGKEKAFFASIFLALSFGHIFRSMANYYRGDNYMLFWYSLALAGIAYALRTKGYRRLVFYLVPTLASGISSVFWQAYYPLFVFLSLNGVFLAIGSFLLDKKRNFLDSFIIILSTAFGAIIANYLGEKFGYGMLGYNRQHIVSKLGIKLGKIRDAYLFIHLHYLVPISLGLLIILLFLSRFVKSKRAKVGIVIGLGTVSILIILLKFPALRGLLGIFDMFKSTPIMETRPTNFHDLWKAFSISIFLLPLFFLRFHPEKVKTEDFFLLGLIVPSLYMLLAWARFVFVGSLAVATMAGIGLVEGYSLVIQRRKSGKASRVALILLILLLIVNGAFTLKNCLSMRPLINKEWENALIWLKNNSNENDVILAWWDYGAWITYYSRRAPVAEIAPNPDVALYYLGARNRDWIMSLGVDYVIVSYYDFLKFSSIVRTASAQSGYNLIKRYWIAVLPLTSSYGGILIFEGGEYKIIAKPGDIWDVRIIIGDHVVYPRGLYVEYKGKVTESKLKYSSTDAYLYINLNYKYAILMNSETFNTPLIRLFINASKPYELVYSDGGLIKILKLNHPNVKIRNMHNKIVFRFENATGTKLRILGFLDNGAMVFEREYSVENRTEFELPKSELPKEVEVIRYAYLKDGKVVDRGVFRVVN